MERCLPLIDDDQILSAILQALPGEQPVGTDLRLDPGAQSPYSRLRDLRAEARAGERAADNDIVNEAQAPTAWVGVETLAVVVLSERSKDLEISAWLAEALVRRHGLAGLDLSARIIAGLVDHFWNEGLFPTYDAEDPEGRVFAVTGLSGSDRDGSLLQPLRKIILFEQPDGTPVALWQYQRAQSVAALNEQAQKQQHDKAGVFPFATLEATARTTGQAALVALGAVVLRARASWVAMGQAFERVAGADAPSTGRVSAVLAELEQIVRRYVPEEKLQPEHPEQAAETDAEEEAGQGAKAPAARTLEMRPVGRTREELLDDILEIAVQFRKNEPNSPLSYTLEEAVRRARLPLPDLLREIIPELSARAGVLTLLGIRPQDGQA
ncbi:type VI secretion system protein TssA [Acetobacteraceae bacterium KSS8]|uniref:Type VI secretion system protein TssA n=1 Tax=Endosaccharibacter trunci TaxID=2812733 RepID=A0ABT1W6Y0_9PROT|nr:type VI secretion system protein TssA [Acetobacteraceae bacterium KSS8]